MKDIEILGREFDNVVGFKMLDTEDNTVTYTEGGGGSPTLETVTKTYTPTESQQTESVSADTGYDGLLTVDVTVNAISSSYVGSGVTRQSAQTLYPSSSDQTIATDTYLTGTQTIKAVTTTNLSASNIKNGVTVEVGDSSDPDRVASVTGTYSGGGSTFPILQLGGKKTASDWNMVINQGHVEFNFTGSPAITYLNLLNMVSGNASTASINSQPVWYTVHSGDVVEIEISNVVNADTAKWVFNIRKANASESLSYRIAWDDDPFTGKVIRTLEADEDWGVPFLYFTSGTTSHKTFSFDISIKVNGTRIL